MADRPLAIAHRGDSAKHVDNTVAAYRSAREAGADWVELDVRRTADGVLVAHHDAHLEDGRLLRELAAADLPDHVPTLAEAFEACEGMGVNVEVKHLPSEPDYEDVHLVCDAVAGLSAAYRPPELLLVSSFDIAAVDLIRQTDATLPTGWVVVERYTADLILERTLAHGHGTVCPWDGLVDENLVRHAHDRGLRVVVWTVDDAQRMAELAGWGVDGIISNDPSLLRQVLDA
ncbi:MAG: glycerophosphodiester phosphodiesterase [Acidimicrobiaceae bacterium]|nr:glycerophosphodiester phosphodiesterase [Acidimicrobiaceae bacterium]|tara:strand:- start:105 stop:797 length:693 start_codon:yes stop_codon:yes gene_type:complete